MTRIRTIRVRGSTVRDPVSRDPVSRGPVSRRPARRDPAVRPIRHDRNRGVCPTFKAALAAATGEYVFLAAADDYRWSSTIRALVKSAPFRMRRAGS